MNPEISFSYGVISFWSKISYVQMVSFLVNSKWNIVIALTKQLSKFNKYILKSQFWKNWKAYWSFTIDRDSESYNILLTEVKCIKNTFGRETLQGKQYSIAERNMCLWYHLMSLCMHIHLHFHWHFQTWNNLL